MAGAHDHVARALELLTHGLQPYVVAELQSVYGERWLEQVQPSVRGERPLAGMEPRWDAYMLLSVMWDQWNQVFRAKLGLFERSLVGELREFRNRWAHQAGFVEDDVYRVLDSVQRMLTAVGATREADEAANLKLDVLRDKFGRRYNQDLARARFNSQRVMDVSLYVICGLAIVGTTLMLFGRQHLIPAILLSSFVVFAFGVFIWQRLTNASPTYGVHECGKCRKIVYTELCPYCDPLPRPRNVAAEG